MRTWKGEKLERRLVKTESLPEFSGRLSGNLNSPSHLPQSPGRSWHLAPDLLSGRLPWRHRARPSATLDEIQGY
jgi:hypothetical protein